MKRRKLVWCILIVLSMLLLVVSFNIIHRLGFHQEDVLRAVWIASLSYISDTQQSPKSIEDLINGKYLIHQGEFVRARAHYQKNEEPYEYSTYWNNIAKVKINFPPRARDLKNENNSLINTATGKEYIIISLEKTVLSKNEMREMNLFFWNKWVKLEKERNSR